MSSWRTVLVTLLTAACLPAAAVSGFFADVVWTGCFFSCEQPDHLRGGLLWLLTLVLLAAGPVAGGRLLRRRAVLPVLGGALLGGALLALTVGVVTS